MTEATEADVSPATKIPVVDVRDLVIEFDTLHGRKRVVDGVSFKVNPGEVLGILGESGSGKTMSTQAILGLIGGAPGVMGGEISLTHQAVSTDLLRQLPQFLSPRKNGLIEKKNRAWEKAIYATMKPLWGQAVTAIFQNPRRSLDPLMTVGQQLVESLRYGIRKEADSARGPRLKDHLKRESVDWLARVQMVNPIRVFDCYPHELSGGMCQRAMIAIALACRPSLLIADEPTTGLDATVRAQIVCLLQELVREQQCAMLYISHDIREVLYLTQRVIVMRSGVIVEESLTDDLKRSRGERHPYTQTLLDASGLIEGRLSSE
jgi:ABC-type dipeptide/oligopeptide/nickel transport system ATPase component